MAEISSNTIINNSATDGGGGISCQDANPTIFNNIIAWNVCGLYGGGIYCEYASPGIIQCTIAFNDGGGNGGGLACYAQSGPKVANSILWGDQPGEIYTDEIFPKVSYSDVQGGYTGLGNINAHPLFVDPGNADFHLKQAPCQLMPLNKANPCVDTANPESNVAGSTRSDKIRDGGVPDMGYHYPETIRFLPGSAFLEQGGATENSPPEGTLP